MNAAPAGTFLPRHTLAAPNARYVAALRNRLERWELEHLRQLAAEQAERIERLERERDDAEARADSYWALTEMARDELAASHRCVGLTRDGALVVVADAPGEASA